MAEIVSEFSISVDQVEDFVFRVRFDKEQHVNVLLDEPPPLGKDSAPNAARMLAAAVGDCLSASLLFCARRAGVPIEGIHTVVKVQIVRNPSKRLRIGKIEVVIDPKLDPAEIERSQRCLDIFEDYCTVTQSIRQGIPVEVVITGVTPQ